MLAIFVRWVMQVILVVLVKMVYMIMMVRLVIHIKLVSWAKKESRFVCLVELVILIRLDMSEMLSSSCW